MSPVTSHLQLTRCFPVQLPTVSSSDDGCSRLNPALTSWLPLTLSDLEDTSKLPEYVQMTETVVIFLSFGYFFSE